MTATGVVQKEINSERDQYGPSPEREILFYSDVKYSKSGKTDTGIKGPDGEYIRDYMMYICPEIKVQRGHGWQASASMEIGIPMEDLPPIIAHMQECYEKYLKLKEKDNVSIQCGSDGEKGNGSSAETDN